jgi:hypothetical protein
MFFFTRNLSFVVVGMIYLRTSFFWFIYGPFSFFGSLWVVSFGFPMELVSGWICPTVVSGFFFVFS